MSATHRVIHIGDLHLGPNGRQADRLAALDLVIATCLAHSDLALWAIPGDLFHSRSSIDDRNELAPRLQQMADAAPVVLVYGNHDAPGDLELLARLRARHGIYVVAPPARVIRVPFRRPLVGEAEDGEFAIAAIPYPSRAGLVGAGVDSGVLEQTGSQLFETLVIGLADGLDRMVALIESEEAYAPIPLVLGHFNKAGARASSGQPQIGHEIELSDAALLRFRSDAAILLNHIHKQQDEYAGSLCRLDYGEVEPKGYVEITYLRVGGRWQYARQFVELPVAPMYHVEGELTRDGFTFVCTEGVGGDVVDPPRIQCDGCWGCGEDAPETGERCARCQGTGQVISWKGSEVRVRYRFRKAEAGVLDVARIHATFADAKSLKLDPVPVLEMNVRAPQIAAAVTLEDKVKACCEVQGIQWTDGLAAKIAALQTQDPAVVLAGITATNLEEAR